MSILYNLHPQSIYRELTCVGVGFPEIHYIQTRQVEDVDRHSAAYRIKQRRIAWMGGSGSRQGFRTSRAVARSC